MELISLALETTGNPATHIIIWTELNRHPITRNDFDVIHPHLSRKMAVDQIAVCEANLERRTWKGFFNRPFELFNTLCIRHVIGLY